MDENAPCRPSGLRAPSKISAAVSATVHHGAPLASAGLQETTESQNNTRAQTAAAGGTKRNLSAHSTTYPDPKRKPLSELQGKTAAPSTSGKLVRGNSIKDLSRGYGTSNTTANATRRQPTAASAIKPIGSGIPTGAPTTRTRARSAAARPARPATSIGTRDNRETNNGTVPKRSPSESSFIPPPRKPGNRNTLCSKDLRKFKKSASEMAGSKSSNLPMPTIPPKTREVSLAEQFAKMSLRDKKQKNPPEKEDQAIPKLNLEPDVVFATLPKSVTPFRGSHCKLRAPDKPLAVAVADEAAAAVAIPEKDNNIFNQVAAPKTPSAMQMMDSLQQSIKVTLNSAKQQQAPALNTSPTKPPFLSRYSNVPSFLVNDIDERVSQMDVELRQVREFMESTERNTASTKEELEATKKRVLELENERSDLHSERTRLRDQLDDAQRLARSLQFDLDEHKKLRFRDFKNMEEDHKRELELLKDKFERESERNEKLQQEFEAKCGAEAEARLENLSQENKDLRSHFDRQKRDHEHETRLLNETLERRNAEIHKLEHELRTAGTEKLELQVQVEGNVETIERLRKRAQDAEERLSKDQGHLGGQISMLSASLDLKSERIQMLEENAKKLQADCELEIENIKTEAEQKIADETAVLRNRLIKEEEKRHLLFEQVQELKGNIRVMCRIKPPSDPAKDALIPFQPQMNEIDEDKIDGLTIPTVREDITEPGRFLPGKPREFSFERVFDSKCTNSDVFDEISQLVQSVMDGKKVCIFCYGQTGSGKTFTMSKRQGDGDDGVIPRTQGMIFAEVERLKTLGWEYTVEGSYLEVYQDKLYDLLASRHSKPDALTVDPLGDELKIKGHNFTLLKEAGDLDDMIRTADANRHVAATAKNDRSSRSHSILVLKIHGVKRDEEGKVVKTRKGTLNLIDLAGSEKPDKNGPAQVYREGVEINSSLSYLRTVLSGLGQGKTEGVDFRSYTLTQLLRPSLGKGCRTLMFVMVSPLKENENETIRSLEFARDAQKVKMGGNGNANKSKK